MKVLYTAIATAEGGRDGHARSLDGNLEVRIVPPRELGGSGEGTNPEQLFAAGFAACFQNAMHLVAKAKGLDLTDSSVTAEVDLGAKPEGTFELGVRLLVSVPELDAETAQKLLESTHKVCPFSNATRGNIPVELIVE
jgi:Ohr subfamily peroxiredoxin